MYYEFVKEERIEREEDVRIEYLIIMYNFLKNINIFINIYNYIKSAFYWNQNDQPLYTWEVT